jgi:hypothetical protein
VEAAHRGASFATVARIAAMNWRMLDSTTKGKFEVQHRAAKEEWEEECKAWRAAKEQGTSLPEPDKDEPTAITFTLPAGSCVPPLTAPHKLKLMVPYYATQQKGKNATLRKVFNKNLNKALGLPLDKASALLKSQMNQAFFKKLN